ncbi:hypothetical protein KSD_69600 [Ktedonobacter sp. SOSP1-85]|nr:hypothetical protein [Ktedonobacter sp. SOSP1-85]GHO79189.1 hypothetical protein KSD_69600 [Ktedonobacter sp. SOSP1-85]
MRALKAPSEPKRFDVYGGVVVTVQFSAALAVGAARWSSVFLITVPHPLHTWLVYLGSTFKTLSQIASEYGTHTNVISRWRDQALAALPGAFNDQAATDQAAKEAAWEKEREELYAEIGRVEYTTGLDQKKCGHLLEPR